MISSLVGYIDPEQDKRVLQMQGADEKFYALRCKFKEIVMDVLISEYVYDESMHGLVTVTGSYYTIQDSDDDGKKVYIPCIYASNITSLTDEAELTNEVTFKFRLSKVYKYLVTRAGLEILFVYGTVVNSFGGLEVCKVCLKGAMARRYKNSTKGTEFTAKAYMKPYGKGVEFLVHEIIM